MLCVYSSRWHGLGNCTPCLTAPVQIKPNVRTRRATRLARTTWSCRGGALSITSSEAQPTPLTFLGYCLGGLSGSFSRSMSSQISVHRQQSEEVSSVPANSSAGPACNKATASVWVHWETYVGQGRNLIHKYRCIRLPRGERQRRVKWNCQDRLITLRVWHRFYCTAQTLLTSTILINDATKMWKFPVFSTCKHPVLHYAVETS